MKTARLFFASTFVALQTSALLATGTVHGVGDLPGGASYSEVRDATRVGGVIYAVGGSSARAGSTISDTAFLWRSDSGLLTALPVLVDNPNATTFVTASAITPDAVYIGSRARAGAGNNVRSAVRVTRSDLTNLNLTSAGGVQGASAVSAISADGEVLYGFGADPTGLNRTFRFTATGPTATALPFLEAGHDNSFPVGRATSADGSVILGTSYVGAVTQGAFSVPGNNAYRYVHGSGIAAIPKLAGGTWNGPLALTPDGVTSLVSGNGAGYPNGAIYLHNATTGAITILGTPNSAWSSGNFGGMTADAAVAVVTFGSNETTSTSQYAYFRNSHGWFHLKSAVAALPGNNAAAWDFDTVFGISPDGTLVFGMGKRNGVTEGYVVDLPTGYLANYNPAPTAPPSSTIVGAWALGDPSVAGGALLVFTAEGTYFHLQVATAEEIANGGTAGMERGRYFWNAATGAASFVTLSDTNGDIGISGLNGITGSLISVSGNTLTLTPAGEGAIALTRVTPVAGTLSGVWSAKDSGAVEPSFAIVFLPNGSYLLADDGEQETTGGPGLEAGSYTWNASTGAFAVTTTTDTNGDWGLSSLAAPGFLSLALDQQSFVFADASESVQLHRIAPPVVSPITTQPGNLTVTSGTNATLTVGVTGGGSYTYQWRRNGIAIAGATNATYTISGAKRADADRYDVVVSDGTAVFVSNPATLSVAPTAYPAHAAYDASFNPDPLSISTRVFATLSLPDGKWMVGGEFSKWGSAPRTFLARLNSDYTLDTSFVPPAINGFVHALARDSSGRIYVGGEFTHVNGHGFPRLFRLNAAGTLDLTWSPDDSTNAAVTALAVDSAGRVLVARQNTFSGGQATTGGTNVLTRLRSDGELDPTFSVNLVLGTNRLNGVLVEPSGSVVFYGTFTSVNGTARNGIARVNAAGVLDTAFVGTNNTVFSAVRLASGNYLLGGVFTTVGGTARNRSAIINAGGTLNTTYVPVSNNGNVIGVAEQADGKILIGGSFTLVNGQASYGVACLTAAGAVDTLYTAGGVNTSFGTTTALRPLMMFPRTDGSLAFFGSFQSAFNQRRVGHGVLAADGSLSPLANALLYRPAFTGSAYALNDGKSVVFGSLDTANGATGALGQAMLVNDNGSLDSSFPQGTGFTLNGFSTFGIYRAVRQGDGKFVAVGDLSGYNGNARTRILRVNGDGSFDPTFNGGSGSSAVFPGIFALSGGRTLLTNLPGGFTYGNVSAVGLLRLKADGTRDQFFVPRTFTPASPIVNWAYEQADGKLVLSGNFTAYDGEAAPGLIRLNGDGSRDGTFNPGTAAPGLIGVITGLPDGRLIVAGSFTSFNGTPANRIVLLQANGSIDASFAAAAGIDAIVSQVLPQEDGKFLVVGDFTGTPNDYVARLNANGTIDDTFALHGITGGVGSASRIFLGDDGSVYVHANPASLNYGTPVAYARFRGAAIAPTITAQPQSLTVAVGGPAFLAVQVSGTGPFTYQWRRNGVAMDDANNSFIGTEAIDGDGNATFDVVITGPGGTVTSNPATLTVTGMTAPAIADQPRATKVVVGGKLILRVGVTGTSPFAYQWRKGGTPIANATNADFVIETTSAGDAGNYDVVVTNAVGSATSATATVSTVNADAVLWQQFTEFSTESSPARIIADGAGKLYVPWTVNARIPDVVGGRAQGALVRLFEADGSVDTSFRVDPRISAVRHVALQPNGSVIAAASFGDAHRIVRLLSDGQIDPSFTSPVFARSVRFVTRQSDGKVLVAATDNLAATILPNALAVDAPTIYRLNSDGSYDNSFAPAVLNAGAVLFSSPVVDNSGRIYLAGAFATVNGNARANVARVNADGSFDASFVLPPGWLSTQARGVGIQSDGRAIVVGDFRYTARGTGADPVVAVRFNADGSFDSTFAQPLRSSVGMDAVTSARLRWIEVRNDNTFYAVSNRVFRFDADGARDNTFVSRAFGREAFWMAVGATGRVYVPDVPSVGGNVTPLSLAANGIAALGLNGEPVEFETGGWGRTTLSSDGLVLPDGRVWMAGVFNRYGSARVPGLAQFNAGGTLTATQAMFPTNAPAGAQAQPFATLASAGGSQTFVAWMNSANTLNSAYQTLVRINGDATVDSSFNAALPSGYNLGSSALTASPGGKLVLSQASVTAQAALNGATGQALLRLNANGSADTGFIPALSSFAIVERDAGNVVTMIRTGGLTVNQVLPDSRLLITVAAVDGNLRVQRLNADGTLDTGFTPPSFGSVSVSSGFTVNTTFDPVQNFTGQFPISTYFASNVIASARQVASGKVYIGGNFQLANSPRGLVRLNGDGTLDTTFNAGGVGVSYNNPNVAASVLAITEDAFGYVYLAGRFDAYNGVARAGIARLRPDGSLDTGWTAGIATLDRPYAGISLQVLGDKLYVFGPAGATTDTLVAPFRVVALPPTPSISTQPLTSTFSDGSVQSLSVQATVASGTLTYQWFLNGNALTGQTASTISFNPVTSANAGTYTVVVTANGNSVTSAPAVVTVTPSSPAIVDQPFGRKVPVGSRVLFRVTARGTAPLTYEWRRNGTPVANGNTADLTVTNASAASTGNYTVVVTNAQGSVESAVAALEVVTPDNVLWQQFNDFSGENSPSRLFSDGTGRIYVPWTVNDRSPDMAAGKFVGALARFDEATGAYDASFKLPASIRRVQHVAQQPDGKLILAVTQGDSATVIRVDATGAIDATFTAPFFARSIRFITRQADGKVLVAAVDVLSANAPAGSLSASFPQLHRLNADGSVDTGFSPATIGGVGLLYAAPAVDSAGRIYLAGSFNSINGTARTNIARLAANGTVDAAYAAALPAGFTSAQARGVDFQSDGRAVFVGDFQSTARGTGFDSIGAIRFNTDGSFDSTFAQPLRSQLGLSLSSSRLRHVITLPDDKLVAVSTRLVRLNADGSVDASFTSRNLTREGFWVARGTAGSLYVPDQISLGSASGTTTLPVWDMGVVKFTANGVPDFSFQTGGFGRVAYATSGRVAADGSVWVSGAFNRFGATALPGIAHFSAPGTLASTQAAAPTGANAAFINVPLAGITAAADNKTYVVSVVPTTSTGPFFAALRRLNADGSEDASFVPVLPANYNLATSSPYTGADGKLILAQGSVAAQVALNGGAGDALIRLNLDGSRDTAYTPNLSSFATVERDANNVVTMIRTGGLNIAQVLPDGRALIVVSAVDGNLRLIRLNASGTLDATFNAPSFGTVTASTGFTAAGLTDPQNPTYVGQFPITTYSAADLVRTAVQMPDGKVYVGGRFTLAGAPRGLVRLNADGSLDSTFTGAGIALTTAGSAPYVTALAADPSGRLYAAGRFTGFNGTAVSGLFRLKADGSLDTAWSPGFSIVDAPVASAQLVVANNNLYAFGTVGTAASPLPQAYAVADITPAVTITTQPVAVAALDGSTQVLSVGTSGTGPFTYQWYRNGEAVTGATGNQLTLSPVRPGNAGTYTVVVTAPNGESVTSAPAAVTVTASAPVFHPANNTFSNFGRILGAGTSDYLTVTPQAGSEPMTYQWLFNGTPIAGATGRTLMINNWQPANAGAYAVTLTNALGSGTSPADTYHVTPEAGWRWRSPAPTGNGLTRVTFANNLFVAGGIRGTLLTSTDGLTWTSRPLAANNNVFGLAYGNGVYVLIGSLNAVYTSTDGINWAPGSTGIAAENSQLQELVFGNGRFVAVGTGGVHATSTDGITWTRHTLGAGNTEQLAGLHFDEDFIAISSGNKLYTSADGITWVQEGTTPADLNRLAISPGDNGIGVAVGNNGAIYTSTEGTTWTPRTSGTTNPLFGVNYVNNQFIAVGALGTIVTSPDGITWTVRSSGGNQSSLQNAAYGNGRYVIVGQGGNTGRTLLTSTDGVTWTSSIVGPYQGTHLTGVASNGSTAVAVGNGGAIVSSTDLATWTQRASGSTDNFTDVAQGGGKFVAVGAAGNVTVSTDGVTWNKQAASTVIGSTGLLGVRYAENQWIVTGNGGRVFTAPDALPLVWTSRPTNTTQALRKVVAGDGRYVAVGASGVITTSSDLGVTWTVRSSGTSLILLDVAFGNGKYVAVGQGGVVLSSTDAVTWTTPVSLSTSGMNGIAFVAGHFIATAGPNGYYTSTDGVNWTGRVSGAVDTLLDVAQHGTSAVIGVGNFGTILTAGAPVTTGNRTITVNAGARVVLNPHASASPVPPSYAWSKAGSPLANQTGPTLTIASATVADAGSYTVTISNAFGSTTPTLNLVVNSAPVITAPPVATAVPDNGTLQLSVVASGTGPFTYQWFRDGTPLPNSNFSTYTAPVIAGNYSVTITNAVGSVSSTPVAVTTTPSAPVFAASGNNVLGTFGQVIPAGTSALLTASPAAGTTPMTYQWQFNDVDIPGATAATYYLPDWQPQHAGNYRVRATNSLGTALSPNDQFYITPEGGWRWRNPTPTGNGLTRGAYLNGEFLVGGLRGTLLASTDGLNWTQRAVPAANNLFAFYYVNGLYVAMGSLNGIFTSPDAIVWTPRTTGLDGGLTSLQDMTAGGGRIVAVGTGGVTSTSTDGGLTWTTSSIGANETLFGAVYILNKFFAVSGDTGRVYTSPDGIAWTYVSTPAPTLRNMAYGAGRLVAVGNNGVIVTSTDGSNWTSAVSGTTNALIGVNFVNNQFVATGVLGTILTSPDGVAWTTRSSAGNQSNLQNTIYGNGRYVIVGQGGNTGRAMLTSVDGVNWSSIINGPRQGTNLLAVASSSSTVVTVGNSGTILTSADKATWTDRTTNNTNVLNDVTFAQGKFIAVGNTGSVMVSTDEGSSWTWQNASTVLANNGLQGIRYSSLANAWVMVANGGRVYTASDTLPFSWTSRTSNTTQQLRKLVVGGGLHVAVGVNGTIITSPDAVTWTVATSGTTTVLTDVAHGAGRFVAVGAQGTVVTSSNGSTWTVQRITNSPLNSVNFLNGTFVATSANHTYFTSTDGVTWTGRFTGAFDTLFDTAAFQSEVVGVGNFGTILTAGVPKISSPDDLTVSTNQRAVLKFAVAETPFPVTYTWTRNGNALVSAPNYPILTIPSATVADAGVYRLTATNAFGSTVSEPVTLALNVGITITTQPAPQTALVGGSATFSVVASGTPAPSYQWRLNGINLPGATRDTVTLTGLRPQDNGLVSVVLTNAGGTVISDSALLTINPVAPFITSPLAASTVVNTPFSYQITTNQTAATFSATPLPAGLTLNASTGIIAGTPTQTGVFNLTLGATNVTGSDSATLQLTVQAPAPVITSDASATGRVGVPFTYVIAASNSPSAFFASSLPPGLTLSGATISGTPTAAGFFATNIAVQNATGFNARTLSIQINPPLNAPVYTGSTTPSLTAGAAFNYTPNFGSGVTNYQLVNLPSGAASVLPAGLTLNSTTGVISGTTAELGTFPIALRATNADGSTTVTLTLTVNPAPTAPRFTSNSSVIATVATPFTFTLTTTPAATTFTATGLPAGLSLAPSTGVISGTPTTPGIATVALTATNASGSSSSTLTITVNSSALAPVISSAPIITGRVASPVNFPLTASNAPESFTIVSGSLPAGLTLTPATGVISGTPTAAGQSSAWLAASNTVGGRGPALEVVFVIERSLNVPVITSNGTATAQVSRSFLYQITATNTPTSYAATGLPDGLTLNATTGVIAGIPSAETTLPVNILLTATNGDGTSAPKLLALTIAAAPATPRITSADTAGGRVGDPFSYQITATENPTSFAADALPAGLSLSSTGLISGTPTASGGFPAALRAANAAGLGQATTVTFTFAAPLTAPAITSAATATGKVGVVFSYQIVATGSPTSYAVTGSLPAGLTLNTTSGVISGNPADNPGVYNVTVTATNSAGTSQPQPLVIAIDPADNVPVITSATSATATAGVPFSYQITATNVPPTTPFPSSVFLDAVNLPPGLAVNPSTGLIQGTPSEAGSYTVVLAGVNANGSGLPRALTLTVSPAPNAPVVNSASNASAQVGTSFSYQIAATNSPTSFEALDAPAWLTVNTATGLLAGTPTSPGSVAVLLRAANAGGASNLAPLSITIAAAPNTPVITSGRAATGRVGSAFSYDMAATLTPTSYRALGLPPMLTIDPATGAIRGTPTVSGTFTVTISAVNANGEGQPVTLTLTISPSLSVVPSGG